MKQNRKIRITIIVLSVLLAISLFALAEALSKGRAAGNLKDTAVAEDNFISAEKSSEEAGLTGAASKAETPGAKFGLAANSLTRPLRSYIASCCAYAGSNEITLSGTGTSDNIPFDLENMFPGDSETKEFKVKVKHSGKVKVHCEAVVDPAGTTSAASAEAMRVEVKIDQAGTTIYDGEMLKMPDNAVYTLTGAGTAELTYTITAYMDKSAGNEFQNQSIKADFKWWLEEVSGGHGGGTNKDSDKDKTDDEPEDGKEDQEDEDDSSEDKKDDGKKDDSKDDGKGDKDNKDNNGKDTGKKDGAPKTGDSQDLTLWIGLAALTGGGSIFLLAKKRQKDGEEND